MARTKQHTKKDTKRLPGKGKPGGARTTKRSTSKAAPAVYEVEAILAKRTTKKEAEYYLKWSGFEDKDNTWEPASALQCNELRITFEKQKLVKVQIPATILPRLSSLKRKPAESNSEPKKPKKAKKGTVRMDVLVDTVLGEQDGDTPSTPSSAKKSAKPRKGSDAEEVSTPQTPRRSPRQLTPKHTETMASPRQVTPKQTDATTPPRQRFDAARQNDIIGSPRTPRQSPRLHKAETLAPPSQDDDEPMAEALLTSIGASPQV